jgi:putative membrane protein
MSDAGNGSSWLGSSPSRFWIPEAVLHSEHNLRPEKSTAPPAVRDGQSPDGAGSSERDLRVYFAAERTFLAWIRTGLALMGFGFVVARFGLFLREFSLRQAQPSSHSTETSLWLGTALVILGVVVNLGATFHHVCEVNQLRSGRWVACRPSNAAATLSCCWLPPVFT